MAELLEAELPDIAHLVTTEMGKPFAQAKAEVAKCASAFRWFAEHAEEMLSDEEVAVDASLGLVTYQPLGPVLAIMPWNFPLWQVTRFLAPALMVGNVGLLKHAPSVPRTALLLEDVCAGPVLPTGSSRRCWSGPTRCRPSSPTGGWPPSPSPDRSVPAGRWPPRPGRWGRRSCSSWAAAIPSSSCPPPIWTGRSPWGCRPGCRMPVNPASPPNGSSSTARWPMPSSSGFVEGMNGLVVGDPFDPASEVGPLVTAAARDIIAGQVEDAR